MNRLPMLVVVGGVTVLAAVAGWFRPLPAVDEATGRQDAKWGLPSPEALERATAAQFAMVKGVPWVGGAGTTVAADVDWTMLGLVGREGERAILLRVGSDPLIKRVRAGDTLPDGSTLVAVGSNDIVMERDGCRLRRSLYPDATGAQPTSSGEAGECLRPGND